ncbi:membrane protein insertase YidC [Hyphomonas johnsonii]|uniref:Membrane protein insertase YidC n=1 Tax=Hyphomonas johnsonii MHS-2 TaxID=1280950 RepID=A0A059FN51_9PROT|nr:membrane protein insertase YidC [Hyphomonas johnsonii]KCZ92100.1 inner membrane protein, 60 kDa [Hyphomonas johnsonii MHS-2]
MEKQDQRNFLIAMALMIAFVFGYQKFFMEPAQKRFEAQQAVIKADAQPGMTATELAAVPAVAATKTVEEAVASSARVKFDGGSVDGSIRLAGARIDDLSLRKHFLTVEKKQEVRLFRPEASEFGYFATYYWADGQSLVAGRNSPWVQVGGGELTPSSPITLRLETPGLTIDRTVTVDEDYMFTFEDRLTNTGDTARNVRAIGSVERHGAYKDFLEATDPGSATASGLAHMGLMGVVENKLRLKKYKPLLELKKIDGETDEGTFPSDQGGWWGLTDKYWMGALVPQQDRPFIAVVNKKSIATGGPLEVRTEGESYMLERGQSLTVENRIFAGAKRFDVLQTYQNDLGIPRMVDAIDWGWAFFLTKPFFYVLEWLAGVLSSFGWAILAFTVLVKLPLVPLFNTSYKSMAKMKKLQEPMKEINERFAADPQRKQQEIMKLYKQEGANPLGGCLPLVVTIPIFYALYKTLYVTLEMRHTPFLFLKDLSAPDPTAIGNLFGLLPWAASDVKSVPVIGVVIGIGILPLLYGITMAALQTLNPPPPDPMQRRVIQLLPLVFMFVFGGFAAGLVLYWVWSNTLSFAQQYFIMRRNGVDTEIGKTISRLLGRAKKPAD